MAENIFTRNIPDSGGAEERRKQQVLAAASRVFADYGYSATIDQIAGEMGVTKGHIYHYFSSKQEILFQIFSRAMSSFLKGIDEANNPHLPVDQRLQAVLRAHIMAICENKAVMTVFMDLRRELSPEHWRQILSSRDRYEQIIQNLIGEGIDQGYFVPGNERILSYAILGSINWVYVWFRQKGQLDQVEIARLMSEYLLQGLKRPLELSPVQMGKTISEIAIGDSASFSKTVCETDVYLFAGITGDYNPLHVNEKFAGKTMFGKRIAHGTMTTALVSAVLGTILPGLGTILLETTCQFKAPVFFGDTITASVKVLEKDEKKNRVRLELKWTNQDNVTVAGGEALVMPPRKEEKDRFGL
jgi:3-hydroxybutyryl-CoA dehydratase